MRGDRSGVALISALLIMVALAAATAGMLIVSTQEAAIASAADLALRARLAAEEAVALTLLDWHPTHVEGLQVGESRALATPTSSEPGASATVDVSALAEGMLLLRAEAEVSRAGRVGSRGRAALLLGPPPAAALRDSVQAALTATAVTVLRGGVDGRQDTGLCTDSLNRSLAGIAVPALDSIDVTAAGRVDGEPPVLLANVVSPDALLRRLSAIGGVPVGGVLRLSDPACGSNTGAECAPLRYAPGDLELRGGLGRGVLLVAGSLRLTQRAQFSGLVIVAGTVVVTEQSRIDGAVGADRAELADGWVQYSACAVADALSRGPVTRPSRAGDRLWIPDF